MNKGVSIFLLNSEYSGDDSPLKPYEPGALQLPVAPLNQIDINENVVVNSETLPRLGSVIFGGGQGATTVRFSTEFPLEANSYVQVPGHGTPSAYNAIIKSLAEKNTIFRLILAFQTGAPITSLSDDFLIFDDHVMIQSFSRVHGDQMDIGVTVDCIKWQEVTIRKYEETGYNGPWKDRRKGDSGRSGAKPRPTFAYPTKDMPIDKLCTKYYDSAKAWKWVMNHKHNKKYNKQKVEVTVKGKKVKRSPQIKSPKDSRITKGKKSPIYLPNLWENTDSFYKITGFKPR